MECFPVLYAKSTGTQLAARHQNMSFKNSVFVMLAPAFSVELFRYRGAAKDGGTLEYVFEAGKQNPSDAVTKEALICPQTALDVIPLWTSRSKEVDDLRITDLLWHQAVA
jgi:hypothetical protein